MSLWYNCQLSKPIFLMTLYIHIINNLHGVFFLSEDTGEKMVVRGCALDSGTLTIDTEIVRMSHCGGFYFDKRYVSGCLQSCTEDACNSSPLLENYKITYLFYLIFVFIWWRY